MKEIEVHGSAVDLNIEEVGNNNWFSSIIKKTPLGECLHLLLNKLVDMTTFQYIESWSRNEYMNIDAHCNINECELKNDGKMLQYPTQSHILHLDINWTRPTCIFPNERRECTSNNNKEVVVKNYY